MDKTNEKTQAEQLRETLFRQQKHASEALDAEEIARADEFCEGYKAFLNLCKTERECAQWFIARAEKRGFEPFEAGKAYAPGSKIYVNNRDKAAIFAVVGKRDRKSVV